MPKVSFHYADRVLSLKNKKNIRTFIETVLFTEENIALTRLACVFCSDNFLLGINKNFLSHDDYTDIITFDLSEKSGVIGEIYISVDRLKENAKTLHIPFAEEALRVIFHGALHLCGYNDKKPKDIKLMRSKENTYIQLYKKSST